ncbi:MAG: TIGR00296 family protein [Nanoarchaeota archaeon]
MISLEQAKKLINLARDSIKAGFSSKKPKTIPGFSEVTGVFVTLSMNGNLRGCIGFPEPVYPLSRAIIEAAQSAAFKDPRFPPLSKEEFDLVTVEISILTLPKVVIVRNPEDYYQQIQVGKDGIIVRGVYSSGLLLPQVAVENNWDVKTFIEQTCVKAGLRPNEYFDYDKCRLYKFQSLVFSEQSPNGEIVQKMG